MSAHMASLSECRIGPLDYALDATCRLPAWEACRDDNTH